MDQRTELYLRMEADDARVERRAKVFRRLMIAGILGLVGLALIAQGHLTPEQRLELFEPHPFP